MLISQRKINTIGFHLHVESRKKQNEAYRYREQTGGCQDGGEGTNSEGINRYTLAGKK